MEAILLSNKILSSNSLICINFDIIIRGASNYAIFLQQNWVPYKALNSRFSRTLCECLKEVSTLWVFWKAVKVARPSKTILQERNRLHCFGDEAVFAHQCSFSPYTSMCRSTWNIVNDPTSNPPHWLSRQHYQNQDLTHYLQGDARKVKIV